MDFDITIDLQTVLDEILYFYQEVLSNIFLTYKSKTVVFLDLFLAAFLIRAIIDVFFDWFQPGTGSKQGDDDV